MNPQTTPTRHPARFIWIALGIIAFGLLMGAREEFAARWQRSLVAGSAGVVLAFSVVQFRKSN